VGGRCKHPAIEPSQTVWQGTAHGAISSSPAEGPISWGPEDQTGEQVYTVKEKLAP
jgi:hypothetical protein